MSDEPSDPRAVSGIRQLRHRLAFSRAQRRWFAERRRIAEAAYEEAGGRGVLTPAGASTSRPRTSSREPHVVVVPLEGTAFGTFVPGTRNFYFEAAESLRELGGSTRVSVFEVDPGTSPSVWHGRLIDYLVDSGATHVMAHVECDPGSAQSEWSWDIPWTALSRSWDGVFLGVAFDSAYEWTEAKARLLARISPSFVLVDICEPMNGQLVRGRREIGPINMPLSRRSLSMVDERLAGIEVVHDVSFVGALYPYRVELIERLRSLGIDVAVNPHRADETTDFVSSRTNQPGWLDYMAGLASSAMTINFSRSSAGPIEQLKTRVIEGMLAGTLVLTDDRDRTRRFWVPEREFGYFPDVSALPEVIERWLGNEDHLRAVAAAGQRKARDLAPLAFWRGIDDVLRQRGLPETLSAS